MLHSCILAMLTIVSYAGEYGHPYYNYALDKQDGNEEYADKGGIEGEEIPPNEF